MAMRVTTTHMLNPQAQLNCPQYRKITVAPTKLSSNGGNVPKKNTRQ